MKKKKKVFDILGAVHSTGVSYSISKPSVVLKEDIPKVRVPVCDVLIG